MSLAHFGCAGARNKGPTACTNLTTIRRDVLEETVLGALRDRMMRPELYHAFATEFVAEWNKHAAETSGDIDTVRADLKRVETKIDHLVDSIENGAPAAIINKRLGELTDRQSELKARLGTMATPAPRLMPNLPELYRERV